MADLVIASLTGGQVERYMDGDRITMTAVGAITGGKLVQLVTGGAERRVQTAGAGSLLCAGLALYDAADTALLTVVSEGVWLMTAAGAITAGQRVICAASGNVAAAGATPDARTVIGYALGDIADTALGPIKFGGSF